MQNTQPNGLPQNPNRYNLHAAVLSGIVLNHHINSHIMRRASLFNAIVLLCAIPLLFYSAFMAFKGHWNEATFFLVLSTYLFSFLITKNPRNTWKK
jgi:hypothetical protein